MKKISLEEFIKRAKNVHGEKYNYKKSVYLNYDTKLEIICKKHGSFWQTPGNHLKGEGCPYCNGNAKLTIKDFIKKAKDKWGDKFDYSLVEYKNNSSKVCIIDKKSGRKFWQTPANHLHGYDCSNGGKQNTENFIINAKKIHNCKYDYSKTEYKTSKDKICIICPIHGEFYQLPYNHLNGQGCPKCIQKSILENKTKEILENNNIIFEEQKRFKWLGKKSLDFYLPDYNIVIECQGKEHLYETGQWEPFEIILKRDIEKYNICKENSIKIVYIISNNEKKIPEFYNDKTIIKITEFEKYIKNEK